MHSQCFAVLTSFSQGGICGKKQWGINIKIEEKLIVPQPGGQSPCPPYKYLPANSDKICHNIYLLIWNS